MNVQNIAGTAATGLLVFLGIVVAPRLADGDTVTLVLLSLGAAVAAAVGAALIARLAPPAGHARQLEYDAMWDHALAELTAKDRV